MLVRKQVKRDLPRVVVLNPGVPIARGAGRQGRSSIRDEEMDLVRPAEQGLSQAPADFPKCPC